MHPRPGSDKQGVRRRVRHARAARAADSEAAARGIAARAADLADLAGGTAPGGPALTASRPARRSGLTVALYVSLPREPGTGPLRLALAALGHRVLLPWLQEDRDLDWVPDHGTSADRTSTDRTSAERIDPMRPAGARLGPGAVRGADLVLVPALAVDGSGTRLGQGGGSYDRALARLGAARTPGRPLVLGVVHDEELLPPGALPVEAHDVPVDGVLTPSGVRLLPGRG